MSTAPFTSLFGSLGLHGCVVLVLLLAVRKPPEALQTAPLRPDPWSGNTVEVEALSTAESTPESTPESPNVPVPAPESRPAPSPQSPPVPLHPKPRRPRPAHDPVAPSSTEGSPAAAATAASPTGAFGSQGLPPGVRSLPSAFTRAIPPATGADPLWQSLPIGTQRPFILAVEVDAEGHIGSAQILGSHDGADVPPQFEQIRQRVIALLGGGLFALQNNATAGRDLFRITITLSDRAVQDESAPAELVERGFEPPRGSTPGRAYFTLASGRHFEAKVEVLGAPPHPLHP